jgi:hypothetical protein
MSIVFALGIALVLAAAALGVWAWWKSQPEARERRWFVAVLPPAGAQVNARDRIYILGDAPSWLRVNAAARGHLNLRDKPGLSESQVIIGLRPGAPLRVMQFSPVAMDGHDWMQSSPVTIDGRDWVYVLSPYGYGWALKDMILMNERR